METTPEWLGPFLHYSLWNQWELLNILCGLPPLAPDVVKPREQTLQEAGWRQEADRHVTDAIRIGDLVVEPTIADQRLLEKITPHEEDPAVLSRIKLAVTAARLYSNAYQVRVDVAIRWAASRKALFPRCPLSLELLSAAAATVLSEDAGERVLAGVAKTDNVFRRRADKRWEMQYSGQGKTGLTHLKGFELIRALLEHPNRYFEATELTGVIPEDVSYGSPVIDEKAKRDLKARLLQMRQERADAESEGNSARIQELDLESEQITSTLRTSQGLRGTRALGSVAERARKAALQNYTTALKRIQKAQELQSLYQHLSKTIRTGQSFGYAPSVDVRWETRG